MRELEYGDRVRTKPGVRTMYGWKGSGTVIYESNRSVHCMKDGEHDPFFGTCDMVREEVAKSKAGESGRGPAEGY